MKSRIVWILTVGMLAGCATTKPIMGPDGTEHQLVTCTDIERCYNDAAEVCGGRYKIINTSSHTSSSTPDNVTTETKLLVKCQ